MGGGSSSSQNNVTCVSIQDPEEDISQLVIQYSQKSEATEQKPINANGDITNIHCQLNQVNFPSSSRGVVGLDNLGNTCFFNSTIQCLSHTQPLKDYFLNNLYIKEINKLNKQGTAGKIALSFATLIKDLQS